MHSYPKISIITPAYNSAVFIEDCIKSVLEQNYPVIEHIIIDGGSKDGTIEILRKYSHLRWISEPDKGQSSAINKGFKLATGDIIGWLNSDDVYLKGTFYKVIEQLSNKKFDAVYSNYYYANSKLEIIRPLITHPPVPWLSPFHCFIPSTTFFFRRSILENGISLNENYEISMDKEFFAHLFHLGYQIKYVNDFFAIFRWHDSNKSIDTANVRRKRYSEGLSIFNRYVTTRIPNNLFGYEVYKWSVRFLLIYRKYLKVKIKLMQSLKKRSENRKLKTT